MKKNTTLKKIKILFFVSLIFFCIQSSAGDFQGGGGGTLNKKVSRYLDTRSYAFDAKSKFVMPGFHVLNTCKDGNVLHTIKKIESCAIFESETDKDIFPPKPKKCSKFTKDHIVEEIPEDGLPICEVQVVKIIEGSVTNVCKKYRENKRRKVKLKFRLDVYRKDMPGVRFNKFANTRSDHFLRKIEYYIPDCNEIEVEENND